MNRYTVYELDATYGSNQTPCRIFVLDGWYAVEGSVNVNRCYPEELTDGVDIELIPDYDSFTSNKPIDSAEEMERQVES